MFLSLFSKRMKSIAKNFDGLFFDFMLSFICIFCVRFNMQTDVIKEGLVIPYRTLHDARISGTLEVKIGEKELIIKEKNITRRMKGYCGKLRISQKEMKEIYSDSILEKYEK